MASSTIKPTTYWVDHEFTGTQITAGTPGTRGLQMSIDNPRNGYIAGITILYISDSNGFFPVTFHSNNKIYCNFYRASGSAVGNPQVKVRICYTSA